jgi:hypothetical protein
MVKPLYAEADAVLARGNLLLGTDKPLPLHKRALIDAARDHRKVGTGPRNTGFIEHEGRLTGYT